MVKKKWLTMVELCLTNNEDILKFWDPSLSTDDRNLLSLPTDTHDKEILHIQLSALKTNLLNVSR